MKTQGKGCESFDYGHWHHENDPDFHLISLLGDLIEETVAQILIGMNNKNIESDMGVNVEDQRNRAASP